MLLTIYNNKKYIIMKTKSVVAVSLSIIGGVAVGAALGILFAPAKGEVTRRRISRKAEHTVDSLKDKVEDLKDSIEDFVDKETTRARNVVRNFR